MPAHELMLANEPLLRLSVFLGILALMTLWEILLPAVKSTLPRGPRWRANLGLTLTSTLLVRILIPAGALGVAHNAQAKSLGLLPHLNISSLSIFLLSLILLDLIIYLQHRAFHFFPHLWRLHRVHHSDLALDATTGIRFHPLEILLSMIIKIGAILALGIPPGAVLVFELVLNGTSLFNHGNVFLPAQVDRILRWILVTPAMHRIHHSTDPKETNSNFGFNLPWWDYLFQSYRKASAKPAAEMEVGLSQFRDPESLGLPELLIQPLA